MSTTRKGAPKDESAVPPAADSSEAPIPPATPQPAEGPATTPEQPATPPERPATEPSDGEKPPAERLDDAAPRRAGVELSKRTDGDEKDPAAAVDFAPAAPITRYVLEKKVPIRAGGYVCTERGWEADPEQAAPSTPPVVEPGQVEQSEKTVRDEQARQRRAAEQNKKG